MLFFFHHHHHLLLSVVFGSVGARSACAVCVSCRIVIDDNNHCETAQLFVTERIHVRYVCRSIFPFSSVPIVHIFGFVCRGTHPSSYWVFHSAFFMLFLCFSSITYFKVWINEVERTLIFTSRRQMCWSSEYTSFFFFFSPLRIHRPECCAYSISNISFK